MCEPSCIKYTGGSSFTCSDKATARAVAKRTYESAVELFAMLCKQYNLNPTADGVIISHREGHSRGIASNHGDPEHLWNGLGMGYTMDGFRKAVKAKMNGSSNTDHSGTSGLQASALKNLSEADVIAKVGPLFTADQKASGILASVSLAQFILESGYGKSELAQNANNCFGMKKSLSGNTWGGSAWDGTSIYTKKTQEYENGAYVTVTADFRKYPSVEKFIADHSDYLLGAKNGSRLRYDGLKGCTDYKKAVQIIKDGYRIEDGRAVIDEEQAERVRKLYRGYLSGLALMPAAKQAGIETWHGSAKRLLQNRHYLGDAYYPAIIDRETFDKAEQELKKRAEKLGRVWEQKEEEKVTYSVDFSTKPMEKQYEDPFMQAEYAYSLIESEG